jgi:hypothetical protein
MTYMTVVMEHLCFFQPDIPEDDPIPLDSSAVDCVVLVRLQTQFCERPHARDTTAVAPPRTFEEH